MHSTSEGTGYVLGHSDRELARLERQGAIFAEATEDMLRRAGLAPGMRVLDVGCGAGDVALIAAKLVGRTGTVLGVDRVDAALHSARTRANIAGYDWLRFAAADITNMRDGEKYDAVTGRFILMHLGDPSAVVRSLARQLRPGGVIAFIEMDIDRAGAFPEMPLLTRCLNWITGTYKRGGFEPNMGSRLFATFRGAGLTPDLHGMTRIAGGPRAVGYDFAAETIRSLLPSMERLGVTTAAEVDVDTLAERLRAEAIAGDHCIFLPLLIGAWAHVPV
jgi:ubiquinone/menaquinone biosynthesis C-methylase UbiE